MRQSRILGIAVVLGTVTLAPPSKAFEWPDSQAVDLIVRQGIEVLQQPIRTLCGSGLCTVERWNHTSVDCYPPPTDPGCQTRPLPDRPFACIEGSEKRQFLAQVCTWETTELSRFDPRTCTYHRSSDLTAPVRCFQIVDFFCDGNLGAGTVQKFDELKARSYVDCSAMERPLIEEK